MKKNITRGDIIDFYVPSAKILFETLSELRRYCRNNRGTDYILTENA